MDRPMVMLGFLPEGVKAKERFATKCTTPHQWAMEQWGRIPDGMPNTWEEFLDESFVRVVDYMSKKSQ